MVELLRVALGTIFLMFFIALFILIILASSVKIITKYERVMIFRVGRLHPTSG